MIIDKGAVDQTIFIAPRDTSSSTMALLAGLVFNTASLRAYYKRGTTGTNTAITLVTTTATGAHTDGGFVVIDATNSPGRYKLDLPDAVVATGVDFALLTIGGAANMEDLSWLIELANPITVTAGAVTVLSSSANNLRKNVAVAAYPFKMVDETDKATAEPGKTVTVQRSLDGGAFAGIGGVVTEVGIGIYVTTLLAGDMNGDSVVLRFIATGCFTHEHILFPQPT